MTAPTKLPERNLDVLRAVAVLLVLASHTAIAILGPSPLLGWLGQAGVQAFFVHTSLVLMGSLEKLDQTPHWWRTFYLRRAFRIYPLAWAAIGLVLVFQIPNAVPRLAGDGHLFLAPSLTTLTANIALAQNLLADCPYILGVLWTLPLELQMYILLPACYLLARRSLRWIGVLFVGGCLGATLVPMDLVPGFWRINVLTFAPCFVSGVLAYGLLYHRPVARTLGSRWWLTLLITNVALWYPAWIMGERDPWFVRAAYCLVLGLCIPHVRELAASRLTRMAHQVATYSYGLYLFHVPALWIAIHLWHELPIVIQLLAYATILSGLTWVGYRLIEVPGIALGRRLTPTRMATRAGDVGALASTAPPP